MRKFAGENSAQPTSQPRLAPASVSGQPVSEPIGAAAMQRFGMDVLRKAGSALAQHFGGVARIVFKRAAQKARDERELYLPLGDEIAEREERKVFVRKVLSGPARPWAFGLSWRAENRRPP